MDAKKLAKVRCLHLGDLAADEIADLVQLPVKQVESTIRSLKNRRPSVATLNADLAWLLRDHFELENDVIILEDQVGRLETTLRALTEFVMPREQRKDPARKRKSAHKRPKAAK